MTTLLEIEMGYSVKLSDAARALLTEASIVEIEFDKDGTLPPWGGKGRPIISVDALANLRALIDPKAEVKVARVISNSTTEALARFGQRNTVVENTRCNVAVAGLGLLTVDEVTNENDCCTDHLQSLLSEGWRILAVCVQPDQRRPDYILGRTNLEGRVERKPRRDVPRAMPVPTRPELEPAPAPPSPPPAAPSTMGALKTVLNAVGENARLHATATEDDANDIPF
jgi:hypothetical protein